MEVTFLRPDLRAIKNEPMLSPVLSDTFPVSPKKPGNSRDRSGRATELWDGAMAACPSPAVLVGIK